MQVVCTKANFTMLTWSREDAGRSVNDAAKRLKLDPDQYMKLEDGTVFPTLRQLRDLAAYYKRPVGIFFLPNPPKRLQRPKDYRAHKGTLSPKTLQSIRRARFVQKNYPLVVEKALPSKMWEHSDDRSKNANAAREWLNLTDEDQTRNRDVNAFYKHLIELLEAKGITLLQHSFPTDDAKAYSFPEVPRVIVLSTGDEYLGGRIFSIFHELCHMSQGSSGLCITNDPHNVSIERECDKFAAEVLLPRRLVTPLVPDVDKEELLDDVFLRVTSEKLKSSMYALLIRLKEFGYITGRDVEAKRREWQKRKKSGGFATSTRAQRAIKENGHAYTVAVLSAYNSNKITVADASYMLNINQGYLRQVGEKVGVA